MKRLLIAACLFAGLIHAVEYRESFPDGRYLGPGYWNNNLGDGGDYVSYAEIQSNSIATDYVWDSGNASIQVDFVFSTNGWFDVSYQDSIVGNGFCMMDQCQYDMDVAGAHYTETFTFDEEYFHRIGHRIEGTKISRWEDTLYKLDATTDSSMLP